MTDNTASSVYRYYDKHGFLIYVGITNQGIARNRQHNTSKDWWRHVVSQQVEHLDSRESALARERELIIECSPAFNSQHNPDHTYLSAAYEAFCECIPTVGAGTLLSTNGGGIDLYPSGHDDKGRLFFFTHPKDAPITTLLTKAHEPVAVVVDRWGRIGRSSWTHTLGPVTKVIVRMTPHFTRTRIPVLGIRAKVSFIDQKATPKVTRITKMTAEIEQPSSHRSPSSERTGRTWSSGM